MESALSRDVIVNRDDVIIYNHDVIFKSLDRGSCMDRECPGVFQWSGVPESLLGHH